LFILLNFSEIYFCHVLKERRLFVKNASIFTSGLLVLSGAKSFATNQDQLSNNLDFTPFSSKKKVVVQGNILDSKTNFPVAANILVKIKRNRFFPMTKTIESTNGKYFLTSGFSDSGKIKEKIEVKIEAQGYKTYNGLLYLNQSGCHIHSNEWDYNPDFRPEYCPENTDSEEELNSKFNFYLVKA
jgi:hypothetical protein